jgi:hypothetical protein
LKAAGVVAGAGPVAGAGVVAEGVFIGAGVAGAGAQAARIVPKTSSNATVSKAVLCFMVISSLFDLYHLNWFIAERIKSFLSSSLLK